jgi:hypothetical protein
MRYAVITEENRIVKYDTKEELTLEELQKLVGGYVERVTVSKESKLAFYVNENGKFTQDGNMVATQFWLDCLKEDGYDMNLFSDYIAGPAVLIKEDRYGNQTDLTDEDNESLMLTMIQMIEA